MKNLISIALWLLTAISSTAQDWPGFLQVLDSDWHEETELLNHRPHCWLSDVHVNEDQSNGVAYVAFGYGQIATNSCDINPSGLIHPNFRAFTLALDAEGEVVEVRTFTHEPYPCGYQRWNNGNLWTAGVNEHSFQNSAGEIFAIMNNSENYGYSLNENTNQYLHVFSSSGEPVGPPSLLIEGSPLHHYEMGGVAPDDRDTTFLVYGREFQRDEVYGEFTSSLAALKKFDEGGNELWSRTYSNTKFIYHVIEAEAGGYWLAVHDDHAANTCVSYSQANKVIRIDRDGNELGRATLSNICFSALLYLIEIEPDVCIGFGRGAIATEDLGASEPGAGHFYNCRIEYDEESSEDLNIEVDDFRIYLPGIDVDEAYKAIQLEDGYLMGGYHSRAFYDTETGIDIWQQRALLYKLDENRDSVWTRYYTSIIPGVFGAWRKHAITDFKPTPDGGYVCVGWMRHNTLYELPPLFRSTHSAFALKVDEHGCLEPGCQYVGVETHAYNLLGSLKAYPNPVTDQLRIKLELPQEAGGHNTFELLIHDLQGRVVYRQNHPGFHLAEGHINVSNFAPGVYTLHCVIDGVWVDSEKVVVGR